MDELTSSRSLAGAWQGYQLCRRCGHGRRPVVVELALRGEEVTGHGTVHTPAATPFTVTGRLDPVSGQVALHLHFARCVDPHDGYQEGGIVFGRWTCPATRCHGGFKLWRAGEAEESASRASAAEATSEAQQPAVSVRACRRGRASPRASP
jgi:hypothetical protein